jgi:hypothetical protein
LKVREISVGAASKTAPGVGFEAASFACAIASGAAMVAAEKTQAAAIFWIDFIFNL